MEALSLIAELSLGLAGFAGVAVVLSRAPGRFEPSDDVRVRALLRYSFSAMLGALVAYGSNWAGASEPQSVRLGGFALFGLLAYSVTMATIGVRTELARGTPAMTSAAFRFWFPTMVLATLAAGVVAAGAAGAYQRAVFLMALLAPISYAAFGFYRLLFMRPS